MANEEDGEHLINQSYNYQDASVSINIKKKLATAKGVKKTLNSKEMQ